MSRRKEKATTSWTNELEKKTNNKRNNDNRTRKNDLSLWINRSLNLNGESLCKQNSYIVIHKWSYGVSVSFALNISCTFENTVVYNGDNNTDIAPYIYFSYSILFFYSPGPPSLKFGIYTRYNWFSWWPPPHSSQKYPS